MTTVTKTKTGFRIETEHGRASFAIGDYGSNIEHDVSKFADGAHGWCVSAIDKLRALAIIGPDAGFAEATPKLTSILIAAGIVPRPSAAPAASPSLTPSTAKPASPPAATVTPQTAAPIASTAKPATDADDAATVAARTNGTRPSAAHEQVLADSGWGDVVGKLNERTRK